MAAVNVFLCLILGASLVHVTVAQWGAWGSWGSCSASCGAGFATRTRTCNTTCPSGSGSEQTGCVVMSYCLPSYFGNTDQVCGNNFFGCSTGVTKCVNITQRCDDTIDCEDGSDENPYFTGCPTQICSGQTAIMPSIMTSVILLVFTLAMKLYQRY